MNDPHSSNYPTQSSLLEKLSDPRVRAIRKELLLSRAALNRLDIAGAGQALHQSALRLSWIGWLIPGISQFRALRRFPAISALLNEHVVMQSMASAVFSGPVRRAVIRNAKPLLKVIVISLVAWKSYKLWKAVCPSHDVSATAAAGE
ncbi:DUF3318 domain-containing protein [Candidatus Vallotia cooleyia]|uniref:DUF3318 domain-containing protein n=1 Tax=Candidatus Vallotiella adelgis TaxID=1177211 RepID=UPI001D0268FB|nr:DUF3318 domain-containing protein [Candidatus Vallotia cooleyia]UDG82341.1 hypothetical protein GJV44_00607 [Candidatus Vallotia cooleyia]